MQRPFPEQTRPWRVAGPVLFAYAPVFRIQGRFEYTQINFQLVFRIWFVVVFVVLVVPVHSIQHIGCSAVSVEGGDLTTLTAGGVTIANNTISQ